MSYHPCPVMSSELNQRVYSLDSVFTSQRAPTRRFKVNRGLRRRQVAKPSLANSNSKNKKVSGDQKGTTNENLFVLSQPRLTSYNNLNITMNNHIPRRENIVYHASVAVSTLFVEDSSTSQRRSLSQSNEKYSLNTLEAISDSML